MSFHPPPRLERREILLLVILALLSAIATAMTASAATRVAIIGGGVSGCAAARRLAQVATPSSELAITLYEIGRGPGGRASTRRTRSLPHLLINHGAPYADIRSALGKSLVASLDPSSTAPFRGAKGSLDASTGRFLKDDHVIGRDDEVGGDETPEFVTGANGEMAQIASSLIRGMPSIETRYKTMVRSLTKGPNGEWELRDKNQEIVGSADWLVVAGSGVAHPRWSATFGGDPPLVAAEREHPDPNLREALDAIAKQTVSPVVAVMVGCSGPAAREWLSLGYDVADIKGSSVLSRVMVQGGATEDGEDWCSVVLHSTEDFAVRNSGVYGASSSAARVGDAASDESREESLIGAMAGALDGIPGLPSLNTDSGNGGASPSSPNSKQYDYGPVLHRWGNAFPKGTALPEGLSVVPSSRVAFCGDYVATPEQTRFGSFESALLSGNMVGEKIARECLHQESVTDS